MTGFLDDSWIGTEICDAEDLMWDGFGMEKMKTGKECQTMSIR